MSEIPTAYDPEADVPLAPADTITDSRAQAVAERADGLKQYIADMIPDGPYTQQALRYVDLAVQACSQACQGGSAEPSQEAPGPQ